MSGLILSAPISGATYTYAYKNTADVNYSNEIAMLSGVDRPEINFVSPVCDELRISFTSPDVVLDKIHLAGLNLSGLSFEFTHDGGTHSFAQEIYPRSRPSQRQTMQFPSVTTSSGQLVISGIAQRKLNIDQVVFCATAWGEHCYTGHEDSLMHQYNRHQTIGFNGASYRGNSTSRSISFSFMDYDEYEDLSELLNYTLTDRYCLVEFSHTQDSQMMTAFSSPASWSRGNYYSFNMELMEAHGL